MKKKLLAVILTATLVASSTIVAFADEGNVYDDGETYNVSGSDEGVGAEDEGTVVNVTGDVTGQVLAGDEGYGGTVVAVDGGTVNVTGNVGGGETDYIGIRAVEGEVNVTGNVTAKEDAINAESGSVVNVEGNVSGTILTSDSEISINGNVQGTTGSIGGDPEMGSFAYPAIRDYNSKVVVNGDVSSDTVGIETRGGSTIVISGTLTAGEDSSVIKLDHSIENIENYNYSISNNPNAKASVLIVHEIKGNLDNLVSSGYTNDSWEFVEDTDPTLKNSQLGNIFYIIKKAADSAANILNLGGTEKKEGYDVATEGTSVVVSVKEGYGVTAGSIKVTKNADGTFTLIVPKGGGVTISAEALQDAIDEAEEKGQAEVPADNTSSSVTSSEPAAPAAPASSVIPGTTGSNTALSPVALGDGAYVTMFTTLVNNTPYGGTVEITVSDEAYLNDVIVASLATRRDVSVKINVMVGGELYVINIPAGYDLTSLIGPDGKISIAALIQLFGTKTNI